MEDLDFQKLTDHGCKAAKDWYDNASNSSEVIAGIVGQLLILRMHFFMHKTNMHVRDICQSVVTAMTSMGRDQAPVYLCFLQQAMAMVNTAAQLQLADRPQREHRQCLTQLECTPDRAVAGAWCTPLTCENNGDAVSKRLELEHSPSSSSAGAPGVCGSPRVRVRKHKHTPWIERRKLFSDFATEALVQNENLSRDRLVAMYCSQNPSAPAAQVKLFFSNATTRNGTGEYLTLRKLKEEARRIREGRCPDSPNNDQQSGQNMSYVQVVIAPAFPESAAAAAANSAEAEAAQHCESGWQDLESEVGAGSETEETEEVGNKGATAATLAAAVDETVTEAAAAALAAAAAAVAEMSAAATVTASATAVAAVQQQQLLPLYGLGSSSLQARNCNS